MAPQKIATVGCGLSVRMSLIPNAGAGLFAEQCFRRGCLITEYVGSQSLIWKEQARREAQQDPARASHWRGLDSGWVIDGLRIPVIGMGGGSFANDGRSNQANNARYVELLAANGVDSRVFLRATRDIRAGEEILVSYGRSYWRAMDGVQH